jgi:Leucine-rich repeat (LRR) protein
MSLDKLGQATAGAPVAERPDTHYLHLKNFTPQWLFESSPTRRQQLKSAQPRLPERLQTLTAEQHAALRTLTANHWSAQNAVDRALDHLQDAAGFAEPLLKKALQSRYGLDLDVRKTFLRLYIPQEIPFFPIKSGAVRAWTVSLLDAALHNFEAGETEIGAYDPDSTFITAPSPSGHFETLAMLTRTITIAGFARLCRELDIGRQYSAYLEQNLGISDALVAKVLPAKVIDSQKAALKAALQFARMSRDIGEDYFLLIDGLLEGLQGMRLDGSELRCHDLTMMSSTLTGIVIFAPDLEQVRQSSRIVAYIPDDPAHPVREYASTVDMMNALSTQLRSPDYQHFFSRFVDHGQRGHFFADLNQRLAKVTWHPPVKGSALPTWRETPIDSPRLQFRVTPITGNLEQHLYQRKLNKILNDAQVIAVATASVDRNARWALWDSFVNVASSILQVAAFIVLPFVPGLGELMMGYMAWQLLDEVFEGIIDWAQGLAIEAFEHLMGALESLIQLGIFAVAGTIGVGEYRKVLPAEIVSFIDRFNLIKSAGGQSRYWKPDLTPYQHKTSLPRQSRPDATGLHAHQGRKILPLAEAHYAVSPDSQTGRYRIEHPTRPDAYRPRLKYNEDGAWHTEMERPQTWDTDTLLERLGPSVAQLSPARRADLLKVSGCTETSLRQMHIDEEPMLPLLADSAKRFSLDQDLQQFVEQIDSDLPEYYLNADPITQLQVLAKEKLLPADKKWNWLNDQGELAWTSSPDTNLPSRTINQATLKDGDLLKTLLVNLSEREVKTMLGEDADGSIISLNVRTNTLRKKLAQASKKHRGALFEERYQTLEHTEDPLIQRLVETAPGLPTSMARAVLDRATGAEHLQIDQGELPKHLEALTTLGNQEVRLTRAYEGLELDSITNPDTDRLVLHSVPTLDGWSDQVRLEIRDRSFEQPPLDSIGAADAPAQKVLVRHTDNTYQPFDERGQELGATADFYTSALQALPDSERKALGIHIGQGERLKQAIRDQPLARTELRTVLELPPMPEPTLETVQLLGFLDPAQNPSEVPTLEAQVREVYPNLVDDELQAMIRELQEHPAGFTMELSRRATEYEQMNIDLHAWANDTPRFHPLNGRRLTPNQYSAARQSRRLFKKNIQHCWRRENRNDSGHSLILSEPILGDLPVLTADFSHVDVLSMEGTAATGSINGFLEPFSHLRRLDLRDFTLGSLPLTITSQSVLEDLILSDCGIRLSLQSREVLCSLTRLKTLDLYNNPLGFNLDFERMPDLEYVDLGSTGITEPPQGWLSLQNLNTIVLNNNQITDLPASVFQLPAEKLDAIDVAGNPLSALCLNRIKTTFAQTGRDLGVLAPANEIQRVRSLYPLMDIEESSNFIYRLPGTLEQGRLEIIRLEAEYATLANDLSAWTGAVPQNDPITGAPLDNQQMFMQQALRDDFKQQVEACWRKESEVDDFNEELETMYEFYYSASMIGELPSLRAEFSHVSYVYLESRDGLTTIGRFLKGFPNAYGVTIRNYALGTIPVETFEMGKLNTLALPQNEIHLDDASVQALAGLDRLEILDLTGNPLGRAPDVSQMHGLTTLSLSNTGITETPNGLFALKEIEDADLSNNAITELPADYLELPAHITESYNFSGNPLSEASLQQLIGYFQRTGSDFGVAQVRQRAEVEPTDSEDSEIEP